MVRRRIGLRWVVVALTLSIVAPLGVVSVVSILRTSRRQLANSNRQNVATVRAISVAIDREVETTIAALNVFAALHALDTPDLDGFQNLASRVIVQQPEWSAILLADVHGRIIALSPARSPTNEAVVTQWAAAAVNTKRPVVSNLFEISGVPGYFVTVAIPIVREGHVSLALGARVKSSAFSAVLRQQHGPPNGVVALLDASNRIVARTAAQEDQFVGQQAQSAFAGVSTQVGEGSWQTTTRDGVPAYSSFSRSSLTGMVVGLALPKEEVDGPVRRILLLVAAAWAVVLTLGASVGILFGHVIVRAMRTASASAMALARGEAVSPKASRIVEIDELATGLREAAGALETRNRERDEASRLKDEFLMTVSHELRTPLTAIYGWARMLSAGQLRPAQQTRALAAIERNAKALEQLVNDLLDVSRVVSGRLRLDVQPVVVTDAVHAAIDAIRPAAIAKSLEVQLCTAQADLTVSGDATRLQQIMWNLLSNAVRHTPAGGRIDVDLARHANDVTIIVRDSGPGIDAAFLPHVFERFRQGVSGTTRAHGGLGLGLAIVRHLVELHGGSIEVKNAADEGCGAVFRVSLPARPAGGLASAIDQMAIAHVDPGRAVPRLDNVSVLVADDDLNARELLVEVLESAGADVRAASSADDALMMLDSWAPDVLLSDIEMPGEDGYVLMRRVRAQWTRRIVAIALTAHARPEDRLAALEAGYHWHLAKPIDPAELVIAIGTVLHERAAGV